MQVLLPVETVPLRFGPVGISLKNQVITPETFAVCMYKSFTMPDENLGTPYLIRGLLRKH